jgi:hypothetical protein
METKLLPTAPWVRGPIRCPPLARLLAAAMTSMLLLGILSPNVSGGTSDGVLNFSNTPLLRPQPTFITFDPPGSIDTRPRSINPAGEITGFYEDTSLVSHGFLRARDGTITTFDVPGSIGTSPQSINPAGEITGLYNDTSFVLHGFLRARDGTIITFDVPGAVGTQGIGINPAGEITGFYFDVSFLVHGFLRSR